jgi:hypothetical protein
MSFRWFIYYCTACGGCAAYVGWVLGQVPSIENVVIRVAIQAMFLGMVLAVGLTLVDLLWSLSARDGLGVAWRVLVAGLVGGAGGFAGGMVGQLLYGPTGLFLVLLVGWSITGLLIGVSPGVYDLLVRLARDEDARGSIRKVRNGLLGGLVGGLLGGLFYLGLMALGKALLGNSDEYWSPSAAGFVVLGLSIGLMIGLAQVILKEAWLRVEAGFRAGRELILSRQETTVGRAETCDIGLFGDPEVEKLHARIVLEDGRYLLEDYSSTGTYLNGERVTGPTPLCAGDLIEMGRCALRFGERQKRPADQE